MEPKKSVEVARPFLKYAGGKTQLLPKLREHVPSTFGGYFEPFVGGGALFFDLVSTGRLAAAPRVVLCDSGPMLMAAYRGVRENVERVIRNLTRYRRLYVEAGIDGCREYYRQVRARQPRGSDAASAAWLIFLNKTGYNGLWRVNRKGQYNVPPGRFARPPSIVHADNLRACAQALAKVTLAEEDFERRSLMAKRGDFVYFDPPYWPVNATSDFTGYCKDGFSAADQERLRDVAIRLKSRGVHVLLSNSDVPSVRKLYARGFSLKRVKARRNINSRKDKRGHVDELLIW
jgi:DNA adenine methylase